MAKVCHSVKITINAFGFDKNSQYCFNQNMHTLDKKSYIVIEVSKDKNKLVPMLALGMGMSNTQAVVIFSLRKENIKLFRKVCTPWAKRSKKNIGVLFLVGNVQGRLRDLSMLVRTAKKSFPDGVTIVVDDYHQFYRNTYDYRKNFIDFPEVLEKIAKEHKGILALFSDSTNHDMCPVCLTV